jgi:hypothetical protein
MNVIDLQYFGTIDFIKTIINQKEIGFNLSLPYKKMSFRNRMVIATAQGPLHLSIPIIGGREQSSNLNEIKIAYDAPWREQHFKAIASCYQRAPYFEYYQEELKLIYQSKPVYLSEFLLHIHEWVRKQIKGNWEVLLINQKLKEEKLKNLQYIQTPWVPKNYYLFTDPVVYQQVFEDRVGFLPNLCILDLLFCCGGKQANHLLTI